MAQKFRKKPVEIHAEKFLGGAESATQIVDWILANGGTARYHEASAAHDYLGDAAREHVAIDTLEGTMRANVGDWIICGVAGEFYSCKPDIFEKTYTAVKEVTDAVG